MRKRDANLVSTGAVVSPWAIADYERAGIEPRHMDHLGFRVEDVDAFKKDLQALVKRNPALSPKPGGTEGEIRLKLLSKVQTRPISTGRS